jgi:hypothetical protein
MSGRDMSSPLQRAGQVARELICAVLGHRVRWVPSAHDETPVCTRCGEIVPDDEVGA